ncbi:MAG: heavy metal translocating P-type ATPase, partial [Gammaproteobacteria bacterium]|nr:heavy metal translocating P-type ATPase [Gammaproteobacteria bacterium]
IFQVGLIAAVYAGVRVIELLKEHQLRRDAFINGDPINGDLIDDAPSQTTKTSELSDDEAKNDSSVKGEAKGHNENDSEVSPVSLEDRYSTLCKVGLGSAGLFAVRGFVPGAGVLALGAYIYGIIPYLRDVEKSLIKEKAVNVDLFFLVADMLMLVSGAYVSAGLRLWLHYLGKLSVLHAKDDSRKMVTSIFTDLPSEVWLLNGSVEARVALENLKVNDLIVVNAGEVIPIDGVIHEGVVSVDQHLLTGEAQPVEKTKGDVVFANTVLIAGRAVIKVEKAGHETTAAKIGDLLMNATEFKSQLHLKGEKWAEAATKPMMAASLLALPVLGPSSAVVLMNSHIGRRIRMLAPMATLTHLTLASHKGVLVKDGRILENLHMVDTILFDKTGTLTTGEPKVSQVYDLDGFGERKILRYAATAEQKQAHPIARAILEKAEAEKIAWDAISDSNYKAGYGITITMEGETVRVGSLRFLTELEFTIPEAIQLAQENAHQHGDILVLVAVDDEVKGAIKLEPQLRPNIKPILQRLRDKGVKHMAIVSGDHEEPTRKLAEELGMDAYFAEVLPEGKADIVEKLQADGGSVCFIGDGINDTIAMKKANASISLAGASNIATDIAEIVLMDGTLDKLVEVFELSEELDKSLKRVLMLTIAPGVINVAGALFFNFGIFTSLAVNFSSTGIVMFGLKSSLAKAVTKEKALAKQREAETTDAVTKSVGKKAMADSELEPTKAEQGDVGALLTS